MFTHPTIDVTRVIYALARDLKIGLTDVTYVVRRFNDEGLCFLTKTLPQYASFMLFCIERPGNTLKDLRAAYADKVSSLVNSFSWRRSSPLFLKVHFNEALSGNANSISCIRQFCEYFYKTAFKYTADALKAAEQKYVETDDLVSELLLDDGTLNSARRALFELFPDTCRSEPHDILSLGVCKDGPGSVAQAREFEKRHNCHLAEFKSLPLSETGSHAHELSAHAGYFKSYPGSRERLTPVADNRTCEVLFVPKDSRGPRTISKEPYFLLKAQMAVNTWFGRIIERESKFHVNFASQDINKRLSVSSSIDRKLATLDLKDASDRVSLSLVRNLFAHTSILPFLLKVRSTHALMPSGSVKRLAKFANMGSGLCFPTLALVVYLGAVVGISRYYGWTSFKKASKLAYVYGDDLIVPVQCVFHVRQALTQMGLALNDQKCYSVGGFRESCGSDNYNGKDVTPVRLRLAGSRLGPVSQYRAGLIPLDNDNGILQLERHCRELAFNAYDTLSGYYYNLLEGVLGVLPHVHFSSPVLGRVGHSLTPKLTPQKCYYPTTVSRRFERACGYKIFRRSMQSQNGLESDPYSIAVRGKIRIKRKVIEGSVIAMYGISNNTYQLK